MPAGWRQGRTAFGGLSAALALQAALRTAPSTPPPLMSAHSWFVGPADAPLRFWMRSGCARASPPARSRSIAWPAGRAARGAAVRATAAQPHRPRLHAGAAIVGVRPRGRRADRRRRGYPGVRRQFRDAPGRRRTVAVRCLTPDLLVWARHRDSGGVDPSVALVALGDCLPPAAMACFSGPAPVSSMTWTLDFPQPASAGDWFSCCVRPAGMPDGYSLAGHADLGRGRAAGAAGPADGGDLRVIAAPAATSQVASARTGTDNSVVSDIPFR
ncbi:acyl-CoA thioesterase domain-containing protein [Xanthomonas theicola]|uniref:acyl-CoA thioesterase domain-containing protein n=1 Tax=Xanthomonas theicola TaxID=56464 RepID=UPI001304D50E|nr:acyl-CoA thioesterase domain-containing protein [Xanthomonas theicola]QNH24084.1 thioesterase family protein [Xanthomonas theicola]